MKALTKLVLATGSIAAVGTLLTMPVPTSYAESAAGTIEGSVVDHTGKVVPAAKLSVTCGKVRKSVSADGAGQFSISGLPEGSCTLTSTGAGFGTTTVVVEVAAGSISTVLVGMSPPAPRGGRMEVAGVPDAVPSPAAIAPVEPAPRAAERPRPAPPMRRRLDPPKDLPKGAGAAVVAKPPLVMKEAKLMDLDEGKMGKRDRMVDAKDRWGGEEEQNARAVAGWAPVRVFPVPRYTRSYDGPRTDFRETIYWNPSVQTDGAGNATLDLYTSDAVTAFRVTAEGFSTTGTPGAGQLAIQNKLPLLLETHLPVEVTAGDKIDLPITLSNETDEALDARLVASFGSAFKVLKNPVSGAIRIPAQTKQTVVFPLEVLATGGADVDLVLGARGLEDKLKKTIRVVKKGFPYEVSASGTASKTKRSRHELDLTAALAGSFEAKVTMYPSPVASMTQGMEGMIREPGGCFEQTSSTNYPNIMILSYLQSADSADPQLVDKTHGTLDRGYKLLTGYETKQKGYEWFGQTPGHEALTAYGLMEFADMAKVYDVDKKMMERTAEWLMSRRDGKGGFQRSATALDSFGRANETTTNAYIMWALAEAGRTQQMGAEMNASKQLGESTKDPYLLALAANTMFAAKAAGYGRESSADGAGMAKRLAAMQGANGAWTGAAQSITMSGGDSLTIETTALAVLALIKASPNNEYAAQIRSGTDYLNKSRGGYGQWGNTQATILGLKALTAYSESSKQMATSGKATVFVNGQLVKSIDFEKGRRDALVWDDLAGKLTPGKNTIEIELEGDASLPYSIAVGYRAVRPQSSPAAKVTLDAKLLKTQSRMGEGVTLRAHVENRTSEGLPMTLARVGIPGGMVFQTWQLKELRDKGLIDFYETRPREVILYWRALAPNAKKDVDINLLSSVPGTYEAPASSAYLYYTAEDKAWTAPVAITIDR
jgi:hypothetical protein